MTGIINALLSTFGSIPTSPIIGVAIPTGPNSANISFTAPTNNGGYPIISYTAISSPGNITATVIQSESGSINITGLSTSTNYTFVIYATNSLGNSPNSDISNSITLQSAVSYTFEYLVVAGGGGGGVFSGGGGGGGGVDYGSPGVTISSGDTITVEVGAGGAGGAFAGPSIGYLAEKGQNGSSTSITFKNISKSAPGGGGGGTGWRPLQPGNWGGTGGGGAGGPAIYAPQYPIASPSSNRAGGGAYYGSSGGSGIAHPAGNAGGGGGGGGQVIQRGADAASVGTLGARAGAGAIGIIWNGFSVAGGGGGAGPRTGVSGPGLVPAPGGGTDPLNPYGAGRGGNSNINSPFFATAGQIGTGGGGGGNIYGPSGWSYGSNGGSGKVVIRIDEAYTASNTTGLTSTYVESPWRYYVWNGNGTFTA